MGLLLAECSILAQSFFSDPERRHMPLFLGPLSPVRISGPMDQTPPGKSSGILGSSHLADLGATSTSGQPDSLLDPAMPKPRDRLRHCQPALWGPFFLILLFLLFSILSFPRFLCQSPRRSLFPWFPLLPLPPPCVPLPPLQPASFSSSPLARSSAFSSISRLPMPTPKVQ